jgi:hypothetical protein
MALVELKQGPTVPEDVVDLLITLESRGIRLAVDGDKLRVSGPDGKPDLTPEDGDRIRKWKPHLLAVVDYIAERAKGPIDVA